MCLYRLDRYMDMYIIYIYMMRARVCVWVCVGVCVSIILYVYCGYSGCVFGKA